MCYFLPSKFLPSKYFSVCQTRGFVTSSFDVEGVPFACASVELIVVGEIDAKNIPGQGDRLVGTRTLRLRYLTTMSDFHTNDLSQSKSQHAQHYVCGHVSSGAL